MEARTILSLGAVVIAGAVVWRLSRAAGDAAKAIGQGAAVVGNAVNPLNHDNVFATGTNAVGSAITGDSGWTVGGAVYDWLHPDEMSWLNPPATLKSGGGGDYQGNGATGGW